MAKVETIKITAKQGKVLQKIVADKRQRMDAIKKKDFSNEKPVKIIPPKGAKG